MKEEIECVACNQEVFSLGLCRYHFDDVHGSYELVDDLAREIYLKEWLIPQKKKVLPSTIGVGWGREGLQSSVKQDNVV